MPRCSVASAPRSLGREVEQLETHELPLEAARAQHPAAVHQRLALVGARGAGQVVKMAERGHSPVARDHCLADPDVVQVVRLVRTEHDGLRRATAPLRQHAARGGRAHGQTMAARGGW
jgi:hypothetical protein